jgi:hypothetical protein
MAGLGVALSSSYQSSTANYILEQIHGKYLGLLVSSVHCLIYRQFGRVHDYSVGLDKYLFKWLVISERVIYSRCLREEYPDLKGVEDPRLTNPHSYKPAYRFGTVTSGSTEEVIKKTYPEMHEYMKNFMTKNVSEGIELVKKM